MSITKPINAHAPQEGRILITPELARDWLYTSAFTGQRKTNATHQLRLTRAMERETFDEGSGQIRFAHLHGRFYLIDGQHRLNAIVNSKTSWTIPVRVDEPINDAALADLYARTDQGLKRGTRVQDYARNLESWGLTPHQIERLGAAAMNLLTGFAPTPSRVPYTNDEREDAMTQWLPEAQQIFALAEGQGKRGKTALVGVVLATAMVTLRYAERSAQEFWTRAIGNDGLSKGEPASLVSDLLVTGDELTRRPAKGVRLLAAGWNAHAEGRTIKFLMAPTPFTPLRLKNTPFQGSRWLVWSTDAQTFVPGEEFYARNEADTAAVAGTASTDATAQF